MSDSLEIPSTIAIATGPLLIGYLFNYGLFGALSVQTYLYYNAFPNDALKFQLLVYGVYIVECVQTILVTHDVFAIFAYGYGNMEALDGIHLIWFHACILPGFVAFTVQIYFAYRLFLLSRSKIISFLIAITALTELAAALATAVFAKRNAAWSSIASDRAMVPAVAIWLGGSAFCDILIALSMTYVLSQYNGGFTETRNRVNRIIRLTMETGSLTAVVTTLHLLLFVIMPHKNYHIAPDIVLAKLYSNSLMVVFNSRMQINNSRGRSQSNDISAVATGVNSAVVFRTTETSRRPADGIQVKVEETTDWNSDTYPMDSVKTGTDRSPGVVYNIDTSNA
ncbi:hypothetical protein PQX77_003247 [Marasmius sp. AFHP31]|nr:hypothetical protein PQX77_003247 [Marasmius sp. AFHP31]